MGDRKSLTWYLFGEDVTASKAIKGVGDESDKTAAKLKKVADTIASPLMLAISTLGPALVPVLATATAGAAGLGVAVASGGAALAVFGAVARDSFKDIQSGTKLVNKGLLDLTSPIGKATVAYQGMIAAWDRFAKANQPAVFAAMGAGFNIVIAALPRLQPLFNAGARAVAGFEAQLSHFVSGGGLDRLVRFLAANAGPALAAFQRTLSNLAVGVGYLGPLMARFSAGVEVGMVRMSAAFATWAQNAGKGGGFQKFLDYVVANAPTVISTIKELALGIVQLAKGLAPLGPLSLTFVGAIARLIATLPPGVITGIAIAFVSIQVAVKGAAIAAETFKLSMAGSLGVFGGIALAVGGLIALFMRHSQAVAAARAQTESYAGTLDKATGAITANTREMAANQLEQAGAFRAAQDFGIGLKTLTDAVLGNADAQSVVNGVLNTYVAQQGSALKAGGQAYIDHQRLGKSYNILADAVGAQTTEVAAAVEKQKRLHEATDPTTTSMSAEAVAAANTARAMSALATQLLKVAGINLGVAQSDIQFRDSVAALTASVQTNGRSLDINTDKGRANRTAILNSIQAALTYADAVAKQTGSTVRGQQAFQNSIPAIVAQAAKLGFNKQQVDALIRSIGGLQPKTVPVSISGVSAALANLLTIRAYLNSIQSKTVAVNVVGGVGFRAGVGQPVGFSRGGPVLGGIPGRDSVPALLMPGEEVLTVPQARAYRAGRGGGSGGGGELLPVTINMDGQRVWQGLLAVKRRNSGAPLGLA